MVFAEIRATWNKVTATPRSYVRVCAVAPYIYIEAEEVSDQRVQEDDDELSAEDEQ